MARRPATRRALALALVAAACAPTGVGPREVRETEEGPALVRPLAHDPAPPRLEPPGALLDDGCGALVVTPRSGWAYEGPVLETVRRGWSPRAEHGRPLAIREVEGPVAVPGRRLWQVRVGGAPQAIRPCFLPHEGPDPSAFAACIPAWLLVSEATPEARPRTHAQWAQLLGLLDGASAVYPDEAAVQRCLSPLPAGVRERLPPLGLHTQGRDLVSTYVERVDLGGELTLLVAVRAALERGHFSVERRELWTIEHEVGR
jgi:hypothetical protein